MQKTNKILSFLLTLCMMLTIALPLTANAANVTFSDVPSSHTYYEAITNLAARGVLNGFEDGSFKPEDPVTRAQFTKIICEATGLGDMTYGDDQKAKFTDVALDHWAIHYITTGYNSKIIKGYGDDNFGPEDSVLYEQAVKMAVCTLGYPETRAEREGGYPNGYIKIATDIKLLKDMVGCKMGEPLSRGAVSQLIDNMLGTKVYEENESGKGSSTSKTDAPTLGDQVSSKSRQIDGRVVAVHGTSIYYDEESECNRKQIELELNDGDREYFGIENFSNFDPNAYLGRSVTVYYDEDNSVDYYEATNIVLQRKKNYEVTINLDDIEDYSNRELEYYVEDEDEPEEFSIDSDICIIRNGAATGDDFTEVLDDALPLSGYITLVCSQNEDVADVAFVKTYETIVVGSKDTTNCKVYAHQNSSKSFTLDEEDRSKTITFTKDGKPADFTNIQVNNILSVSTSDDGKLIDVQISSATKNGTVTDIMANDRIKLDSNNTLYRFSDSCDRAEQITAGSYLTLYLDAFGKIARYVISAEKAYTFGYLAALEDGTMTDPKVEVMVYKLSNSASSNLQGTRYVLKDNVRIDDKVYSVSKNADEIVSYLERIAADSKINPEIAGTSPANAEYAQPIRFTTSTSNVIDRILTVKSTGEANVSMNMIYHTTEPVLCRADKTTLGNYSISSSVPIIVIPSDRTGGTYMTKSYSYFEKDESYYVQLVNVNSANQPQAIYVYGTKSAGADASAEVLSEDNLPMMVTNVSEVNYMGEARLCLKLLGTDGSTTEVYDDNRKDTEVISTVVPGDVIRVAADAENMVDAIEVLAIAADVVSGDQAGYVKIDGSSVEGDLEAPFRVVLGTVRSVYGNSMAIAPSLNPTDNADEETYTYAEGIKVYMVDTQTTNETKRVSESVFGEVVGYAQQADNASKVMVYTEKGNLKAIIIFK